jgi:NAD(P)-dependent dehydrogenase (short-subunit alcohol dehydrogenase family)
VVRLVNSYSEQKLWQEVNILLLYWFDVTKQTLGPDARQTVQAIESAMGDASGMKRIGQPIEVGRVAAFLASDEASYMTGNAVEVTGGLISAGIN